MEQWLLKINIGKDVSFFKKRLDDIIMSNNIHLDTSNISTTGKNCEQYNLFSYSDQISDLIEIVRFAVTENLKNQNLLPFDKKLSLVSAWTVLGKENCFHKVHIHNEELKHIATSTYISIPENTTDKPGLFFAIINNKLFEWEPSVGDILIFPVNVFHGTYPQGSGLRQSLNLDFEIL